MNTKLKNTGRKRKHKNLLSVQPVTQERSLEWIRQILWYSLFITVTFVGRRLFERGEETYSNVLHI